MRNLLSVIGLALLLCACAAPVPSTHDRVKPFVGMTKKEVEANYGKPGRITFNEQGETWIYDNLALAAIPFNFGFRPKFHTFVFSPLGRLEKFNVDDF